LYLELEGFVMSDKENQNDTDPRIMIAQMNQAWSDARSYTGNIWQVAALCLTAIALSLNFMNSSTFVDSLLVLILIISSFLAAVGVFAIQWLRFHITYRIVYIQIIEGKLAELQDKYKVTPSLYLFGLEKGPLALLFYILIMATEVLFCYFVYTSYWFFIGLGMGLIISIFITAIIFLCSIVAFSWYVFKEERTLRRREKETARDWKVRYRQALRLAIDDLRIEGHDINWAYTFPTFQKDKEIEIDIVIKSNTHEIIFMARDSYWAAETQYNEAVAFENQVIFIVTPHYKRFPKGRHRVFAISPAVDSKELGKYILDGLRGKLNDSKEEIFES
jgi:hypothetical protein